MNEASTPIHNPSNSQRSATPTVTPTPLTLTRTTSKAAATLTSKPSEPLGCCHNSVRVRHRVSTTTPHAPRIDIVRQLPVCRSTDDDNEMPPKLHVVRLEYAQSPIHIRLALCRNIHSSTSPITTINRRTRNDVHPIHSMLGQAVVYVEEVITLAKLSVA